MTAERPRVSTEELRGMRFWLDGKPDAAVTTARYDAIRDVVLDLLAEREETARLRGAAIKYYGKNVSTRERQWQCVYCQKVTTGTREGAQHWAGCVILASTGAALSGEAHEGWTCNECGAREFTGSVSAGDLQYLACSACGGNEFHRVTFGEESTNG